MNKTSEQLARDILLKIAFSRSGAVSVLEKAIRDRFAQLKNRAPSLPISTLDDTLLQSIRSRLTVENPRTAKRVLGI